MKVDYSQLRERFAHMTDAEFALERREDLDQRAQQFYDDEKMRRTPGWRYTPPTPEAKARDLEAERDRTLRRFRRDLILWVLISGLLPMLLTGYWPLIITALGISWELLEMRRTGRLVVWLRRFHVKEKGGIRFSQLLGNATKGIGLPVTIQDSAFRFSGEWAFVRFVPYWFFFLFLAETVVLLPLYLLPPELSRSIVLALAIGVGLGWLAFLMSSRRFGWERLQKASARSRTLRFLQYVRERRGRFAGVVVLKCEDDFWRDIVQLALENADAVVIDVTRPSENLLWELQTALRLMPAESILLACGPGADEPRALPPSVTLELENAIGKAALARVGKFYYPRLPGFVGISIFGTSFSSSVREPLEELVACLIRCVSYSRH